MTAVFDTLRSLGMKAIVRYSYVQCEKADGSFIFQEDPKKGATFGSHQASGAHFKGEINQSIGYTLL